MDNYILYLICGCVFVIGLRLLILLKPSPKEKKCAFFFEIIIYLCTIGVQTTLYCFLTLETEIPAMLSYIISVIFIMIFYICLRLLILLNEKRYGLNDKEKMLLNNL